MLSKLIQRCVDTILFKIIASDSIWKLTLNFWCASVFKSKTSIKNLLQTNFYERPFQPRIGSNVKSLLFELATPQTQFNVKEAIIETIENFEPRCRIIDVLVESDEDRHNLNVYITFQAINAERPATFSLVLDRVR